MKSYVYRIHPGIGIARVGNSPNAFFIGPEAPGVVPEGPFKDDDGRIARQGVRFRVYRYTFEDGQFSNVKEITTTDNIAIHWSVHLVNRKATARHFPPIANRDRNESVALPDERMQLVIDSGNQSISGRDRSKYLSGSFHSKSVALGDLKTDENGRLIALGGFGQSGSVPSGLPVQNFANNDGWYDDTSDGPVRATIEIKSGTDRGVHMADPAWIVVAPPAFAPGISNVVTWYDHALEMAILKDATLEPKSISFTKDIYPILSRIVRMQWVDKFIASGHSAVRPEGNFLASDFLEKLANNSEAQKDVRKRVLEKIRIPNDPNNFGDMPNFGREGLNPENPMERIPASLTKLQIMKLKAWADGKFDSDFDVGSPHEPMPFENLNTRERPDALDRAALEACIGGPFFPGIECGYIMARPETYDRPFRISRQIGPGEVTAGLAVPWQADFYECRSGFETTWWPAARPNQVFRQGETVPVDWVPSWFDKKPMVDRWWMLGFIVQHVGSGEYRESDRDDNLDLIS